MSGRKKHHDDVSPKCEKVLEIIEDFKKTKTKTKQAENPYNGIKGYLFMGEKCVINVYNMLPRIANECLKTVSDIKIESVKEIYGMGSKPPHTEIVIIKGK